LSLSLKKVEDMWHFVKRKALRVRRKVYVYVMKAAVGEGRKYRGRAREIM
jgi:hypothetical protein